VCATWRASCSELHSEQRRLHRTTMTNSLLRPRTRPFELHSHSLFKHSLEHSIYSTMGLSFSSFWARMIGKVSWQLRSLVSPFSLCSPRFLVRALTQTESRIVMVGLDAAGKTTSTSARSALVQPILILLSCCSSTNSSVQAEAGRSAKHHAHCW
jgi:hypothetical protein